MNDPTEPYMVLRASDPRAMALVNLAGAMVAAKSPELATSLFGLADRMMAWRYTYQRPAEGVAGLRTLAEAVALLADMGNCVVRIEPVAQAPLRQGNYVLGVQVYPRHAPGPGFYPSDSTAA